jgi:hypothetical protein
VNFVVLSRLTRFETTLTKPEDTTRIFQFFAIQKELQSVSLWFTEDNDDGEFTKKLIFHILEQCSKLSEFYLNSRCLDLVLTSEESDRFLLLISKLQVLSVDFSFRVYSAPTLSPMNFALNAVSVPGDDYWLEPSCNLWFTHILTYCSQVQHLEIVFGTDDVSLQKIFEYMVV